MKYLGKILKSKLFIVTVSLILLYTLAGFLLTPYIVRHYTPKFIHEKLKKEGAIGKVRFNPYIFTFEANDFQMTEPNGSPIINFKRLFIDFELKSLFKWAWIFRQVSLEEPGVHAVIEKDGRLNLASLAPPPKTHPRKEKGGQFSSLVFEDIEILKGRIDAADKRQSQPAVIAVHPLNLHLKNLTTLKGQIGDQILTATTINGEKFQLNGKAGLNPMAANGSFSIENLRISTLMQFARDALNLDQPKGELTIKGDYKIDLTTEKTQAFLSNLSVALTGVDLRLRDADTHFLELPSAVLSKGGLDLSGRKFYIGSITVKGGKARILVGEDGKLNVQRIVKVGGDSAPPAPQKAAADEGPWKIALNIVDLGGFAVDYQDLSRTPALKASVEQIKIGLKAELETGRQTKVEVSDLNVGVNDIKTGFLDATEPVIRVDTLGLRGGAYHLVDNRFTAEELFINGGSAEVRRERDDSFNLAGLFSGKKDGGSAKADAPTKSQAFTFLVNKMSLSGLKAGFYDLMVREDTPILNLGDISATMFNVDGRSPMKFDVGIQVQEGGRIKAAGTVDPSALTVDSEVQVADLDLPIFQPYIGNVAEVILKSGKFSTRGNLRHGIKSAGAQTVYDGGFKVEKLRVIEKEGNDTLVGWKSVKSDHLKLRMGPDGVDVGEIIISQLNGKVIISKDKSLNLAEVIKSESKPKDHRRQAAPSTAGTFPYRVGRVLMENGRVEYADLSLPLPFRTRVHQLKGSITNISSAKNARAKVKLDGRVDDYGTAKVDGEINTSNPKGFTDLSVIFRNVEMSRLTPYSGRFAGRKIDSGKLSADLKYKIVDSQLTGDNKIVVERLKLGEKIESPDAVNLPLDLAVALLEDSNGVIDLGLPVHGDLNSPEFSYGALIFKAIANVLTKIVTSPFRALAALIPGGGEETLKSVAFEPGSAEVPPPEKEKLAKLAEALQKRPQLKLTVQGRYNSEADGAVLRKADLSRALAARLGRKIEPDVEPDWDFRSPEVEKALERMFSEHFGADALKALKSERMAIRDKAKKEALEKGKSDTGDSEAEGLGKLAEILFERLQETVPVGEAELMSLADKRAQSIIGELSGKLGIPADRLATVTSAAVEKSDPITAALSLEIMH